MYNNGSGDFTVKPTNNGNGLTIGRGGNDLINIGNNNNISIATDASNYRPGFELWGHAIDFSGDNISCHACDMEEEIPELLEMTKGFREVVYKLYVLKKFKKTSCKRKVKRDDIFGHNDNPNHITYDPHTVNWTDNTTRTPSGLQKSVSENVPRGTRLNIDGTHWAHEGDGYWTSLDDSSVMSSADMHTHHGKDFTNSLAERMMNVDIHKNKFNTPSRDSISKSTSDVDVDVDMSEEEVDAVREKAAKKLCERKGLR